MKTFTNINTTVDLKDNSEMESVEMTLVFPKTFTLIEDHFKTFMPNDYKTRVNGEGHIIMKMNVKLTEKQTVVEALSFLKEMDDQYSVRAETVNEFLDLLK